MLQIQQDQLRIKKKQKKLMRETNRRNPIKKHRFRVKLGYLRDCLSF